MEDPLQLLPLAEAANPWRSCLSTLLDREARTLELHDGTKLSLDSVEFQNARIYPNTSWRRKSMAKDGPPQKEVVLLDPEVLAKAQLELARSHKGGYTSKA